MAEVYRAIRHTELGACLDLWGRSFPHIPRDYFVAYFDGDPCFTPEYTRVCEVDGRLVSAVQICERRVRVGSAALTMGGIANVGTDPDSRGRGYSTRLLQDSVSAMRNAEMDFSALYTGINPFYERVGWMGIPGRFQTGEMEDFGNRIDAGEALRPCNWDDDLGSLMSIYDEFNRSRTLTAVRSADYWAGWVSQRTGRGASILVAEDSTGIAGYIQSDYDDQNCRLREIAYRTSSCAVQLIEGALSLAYSAGARTLWNYLPCEPDVDSSIRANTEKCETRYTSGDMYRLIDADSLMRKVRPELQSRLISANQPSCLLSIHTDDGIQEMRIDGAAPGDPVCVTMGWCDFLSMLFSRNDTRPEVPPECVPVVACLFPKEPSVAWSIDHF